MISDMAPLRRSPDDLYQEFINLHEKYLRLKLARQASNYEGDPQVIDCLFDMAYEFEGFTEAHLKVLMDLRAKRSLTEEDSEICEKLEVMLKEERNTWRLVKALHKDQLLSKSHNDSQESDRMMDTSGGDQNGLNGHNGHNGHYHNGHISVANPIYSEDQLIREFFQSNSEVLRMQLVCDWLEANEWGELSEDDEERAEFLSGGRTAWEDTLHAMRSTYRIDIPDLDITMDPNADIEICDSMDPDAPIRTKKSLVHSDKELEIRLFKHMFRFIRAGRLIESQEIANRVKYHWLAGILDGWLPYSDPNLEARGVVDNGAVKPVSGNRKRDIWKLTCFKTAKIHGLTSFEKAILGVLSGNLKSVLPVCNTWSDQLWSRLRCAIDVKVEIALRSMEIICPGARRNLVEFPQEFYDNYQDLDDIFDSIKDLGIVSPFKEATIHQTVQKYLILNDIDGLLVQLSEWCASLDYDNNTLENNQTISPHFLRCFAHIVLFLRDVGLVSDDDIRGTKIIESYIAYLSQLKLIESVAYYAGFLPQDNQISSFANLLATIDNLDERKRCLKIAKESRLDVDMITQTVVALIRNETPPQQPLNTTASELENTKTSALDKKKINALDYLLYLGARNNLAILHHGNIMLRNFALQRKVDAVKETFSKLPQDLGKSAETQWLLHNTSLTPSLVNSLRELNAFKAFIELQEALSEWSDWHRRKPEKPRPPANLSNFCANSNYEKEVKTYEYEMVHWKEERERRANLLKDKTYGTFFSEGHWMKDSNESESDQERTEQLRRIRKYFVPYIISTCFNVLQLTNRYEDCLKLSNWLVMEPQELCKEFTKAQLREFLDKTCEVTKIVVKERVLA